MSPSGKGSLVKPREYLGAPAHLRQARCDAVQAAFRAEQQKPSTIRREPGSRPSIRRDPPPLAAALVPTDDLLKLRLAEELEYARRLLDLMGDELSADSGVLMRHAVPLQSVDIVGQIMGHIANVIRSSDPEGAVDRIGMAELKSRLQRQSIG
jgi:hypothetical protein